MSVYTQGIFSDPLTQDDLAPTGAERRRAIVEETFGTLVGPALHRWGKLDEARRWGGMAFGEMSPDDARGWIESRGLKDHLSVEERPYNKLELSVLAERKEAELRRRYVLERAEGGFAQGSERLLLSLGTSLMDPLTVATAFVPVVSQARYATLLERAGAGVLARAGTRAAVGAIEGAVGQALVEPFVYASKQAEQADYTAYDSLANIAFGGVFGGGLHSVGGAVMDVRTGRRAAVVERATDALRERLVEIDRKAGITPETTARVAEGGPDPYLERARALLVELRRAAPMDVNDPKAVSRHVGQKVQSLSQYVRETGGIADNGGELAARDVTNKRSPGLVRKDVTAESSIDAVRQRVFDAGYFPGKRDYNEISDSELFDAIADDLFTEKRYPVAIEERLMEVRNREDFAQSLRSWGIDETMDVSTIADRLREADDVARLGEPPPGTAEADAEYVTAAARAERAAAETREAALHGAVAQDLAGDPVNVEAAFELDPATRTRPVQETIEQLRRGEPAPVAEPVEVIEAAEAKAVEEQIADLEATLKDLEDELALDGAELPEDVRAELDEASALAEESDAYTEAARMLAACAMRTIA